jgi:hypothetical protein
MANPQPFSKAFALVELRATRVRLLAGAEP